MTAAAKSARASRLRIAGVVGLVCWTATWVLGSPAAERAIVKVDQRVLDAYYDSLPLSPAQQASTPRDLVEGFTVERKVVLPGLLYYTGQTQVRNAPISCDIPRRVVAWYGFGAIVLLRGNTWFPDTDKAVARVVASGFRE